MIEKRSTGKFRARIYQGRGNIIATSPAFNTKTEAKQWEIEYKRKALHGELGLQSTNVSIRDALAEYAEHLKGSSGRKHRTEVLTTNAQFIDQNHITMAAEYTADRINEAVRGKDYSSWYAHRMLRHLQAFARFMFKKGYLREDVSSRVNKPRTRNTHEPRALSDDEIAKLLSSVETHAPRLHPFVSFLLLSGCRKLEGVACEWTDIDFEAGTLTIRDKPHLVLDGRPFRCKWGSGRTIPMSEELRELLQAQPKTSTFVFPGPEGGDLNYALRGFRKCVTKSGLDRPEEVDLHSLRHTWVTRLAKSGMDIFSVSRYAGHRNITTTQRYLHGSSDPEKFRVDAQRFPTIQKLGIPRASPGAQV